MEQCSLTSPFVWQWSKLFSHFLAPQTSWEEPSEFSNAQWGQSIFEFEFTFSYNLRIFAGFEFRNQSYCKIVLLEGWWFVYKIVLTLALCEKKMFSWLKKTFEILGWRLVICKMVEMARTIHLNSERSEQFLKKNAFFT